MILTFVFAKLWYILAQHSRDILLVNSFANSSQVIIKLSGESKAWLLIHVHGTGGDDFEVRIWY